MPLSNLEKLEKEAENTMDLHRSLGRLEGKLDLILTQMASHFVEDKAMFSNIDRRLMTIERKVWGFTGIAAMLASGAAIITSFLVNKVFG